MDIRGPIQNILKFAAQGIVSRYKPTIIGITGSSGKTSTREAIFAVVSQKYDSRRPQKNFNNEFGLPLAIIGSDSPGKNPFKWLWLFIKIAWLLTGFASFPKMLVLEYGIDKPGDMDYLTAIAKPTLAVLTATGLAHREFFENEEQIAVEKKKLLAAADPAGAVFVNTDRVSRIDDIKHAHLITYGHESTAQVYPTTISEDVESDFSTHIEVPYRNQNLSVLVHGIGTTHQSAALAAIAVADYLHIEPDLVICGLSEYKPAPGRMNIINGLKKTILIDDTYNAADPEGVKKSLDLLMRIPRQPKIAIIGTMRELGSVSRENHEAVGRIVSTLPLDMLITVGEEAKIIADTARAEGFSSEKISSYVTSVEAIDHASEILIPGSIILLKGSQYVRLEKLTKELMAEPMRASELLCRQSPGWLAS
jgi:UDP-N-acetylmuramyl pentapeptide synthase